MEKEKRTPKSYKVSNTHYWNAMQYAKKRDTTLAKLIENYVRGLANLEKSKRKKRKNIS